MYLAGLMLKYRVVILTNTHELPSQVDTPAKKALVGIAIGYVAVVLLLPTMNIFIQVNMPTMRWLQQPTVLSS